MLVFVVLLHFLFINLHFDLTRYAGTSFDVSTWHRKFQGIYLILSLHAHGERAVLEELGSLAASYADNMQLELDKVSCPVSIPPK